MLWASAGIRGGIGFDDTQRDRTWLLVDCDMSAALSGGKGNAIASGQIACRRFGFD